MIDLASELSKLPGADGVSRRQRRQKNAVASGIAAARERRDITEQPRRCHFLVRHIKETEK